MLAVYGHTVTWKHLILTAATLLLLMCVAALGVGWWAWQNLSARVILQEQDVQIRLPKELTVEAEVSRQVQVKIDQTLPLRVPVQADVSIALQQSVPMTVSIDTVIPIRMTVPIKQVIEINQEIELDTQVQTRVLGIAMTLPIKGKVPVKASVPIDLNIPIAHDLPVALVRTAHVTMQAPLRAHIDTVIETRVPIQQALSVPLTAPVSARLTFPQPVVHAGLDLMDLTIPFSAVTLGMREAPAPAR